jgi:Na+/melibiose symporter-like transporter
MFKRSKGALFENKTFQGDNVPKLTRILYPWSGILRDACYTMIGTFLMQYAITAGVLSSDPATFQVQYGIITVAMIIALVWDGLNDPIMGFIIEKVHLKAGKYRPWIALGAIGNALMVALMFLVPLSMVGGDGWGYVVFMIIAYVLWDACFTMNDIGYWSMLPSLTNDPKQRARITTNVTVAASIGTAIMTLCMYILPGLIGLSTASIYALIGSLVAFLFLISQLAVYFLCREKARDSVQEQISESSSIVDLFRVVIKNHQLLYVVLALLFFQFAEFILTGIGQNYFYMVFGYGGKNGGLVATAVLAIYIVATVLSQLIYPWLAKKMKQKNILTSMGIIIIVGYLVFYFVAFPLFGDKPLAYNTPDGSSFWILGGTMWLYYVTAFFFFGASGIFYLVLLVLMQNAIDYNEWKYGERKESICFAWRPLDVKLCSGLNRGLQYIVYIATGTYAYIQIISNNEASFNSGAIDADTRNANIAAAMGDINQSSKILFGSIVIGTILVSVIVAYALLRFGFKVYEEEEAKIVKELAERHQKDEEAELAEAK